MAGHTLFTNSWMDPPQSVLRTTQKRDRGGGGLDWRILQRLLQASLFFFATNIYRPAFRREVNQHVSCHMHAHTRGSLPSTEPRPLCKRILLWLPETDRSRRCEARMHYGYEMNATRHEALCAVRGARPRRATTCCCCAGGHGRNRASGGSERRSNCYKAPRSGPVRSSL